jgi:O-Antigen ligase
VKRLQALLRNLQSGGLLLVAFLLVCYPLVSIGWDFLSFFVPGLDHRFVLLSRFMMDWDAGAQSSLSRALFRALVSTGCLFGLLLPIAPLKNESRFPWGAAFLLTGLVSCVLCSGLYRAESEWETWALLLLLGALLRRACLSRLSACLLVALYATLGAVYLHALWIAIPGTSSRLGGVFHHPNALSTMTLAALPVLAWRLTKGGKEAVLAGFLLGSTLALQIWTGSLTGASLLLATLAYLSVRGEVPTRVIVSGLALMLPTFCNLSGNWVAALAYPVIFLLLLARALVCQQDKLCFKHIVLALCSLAFALLSFTALSSTTGQEGIVHSRNRSGAARAEFYRAGLQMVLDRPLFGSGPGSFAREYPSRQSSIKYFSNFIHCIPLELAVEWGLLSIAFGMGGLIRMRTDAEESAGERVFIWSFGLFAAHCLSGVQSQFPYLVGLSVLAWSARPVTPCGDRLQERVWHMVGRVLLAATVLSSLCFNLWRATASFDRTMALHLYRSFGRPAAGPALLLMESSALALPQDGQTWLHWAQLAHQLGQDDMAVSLSSMAIDTDHRWAAPREVMMDSLRSGPSAESIEAALAIDPVNYPAFYRFRSEVVLRAGQSDRALSLLQEKSRLYDPFLLESLPEFRASDLKEQLVEYCLLSAILSEQLGQEAEAESSFRLALYYTEKRLSRLRSLLDYPKHSGVTPGPMVSELLIQVAKQVPTQDIPRSIQAPTDQTVDL